MIFVAVFVSTFCLTLVKVGAGYAPLPLPFFLPVTQNYHEAPIPENSKKKIKIFSFTPLSEHFEIWV